MTPMTASLSRPQAVADLEHQWRALEDQNDCSFFQSWAWASALIDIVGDEIWIVQVKSGDRLTGLGVLCPIMETRHRIMKVRQLRLNEIGRHTDDLVQPEFNTLLAAPADMNEAYQALFERLEADDAPQWDELIFSNTVDQLDQSLPKIGWRIHRRTQAGSGFVDLGVLRDQGVSDGASYIQTLGKNTKSQIKRSIRLYEEIGPLKLERARSVDQAQEFFYALSVLHTDKWNQRGGRGLLDGPTQMAFQNKLIERSLDAGHVEVLKVSAGDTAIAYLHNFLYRGAVLFNVAGFTESKDNKLKPGLVAHMMAIEVHLQSGADRYDFLAGDDRYKQNLGQAGPEFVGFAIQRDAVHLRIEHAFRMLKHRLGR